MKCRYCASELTVCLIDLGSAPPSNAYLTDITLHEAEQWIPLRVMVCTSCWLVQTEDYTRPEVYFDAQYAYFSSTSTSWLLHAQHYVANMTHRFGLSENSMVVEVAANDGYLLQYVHSRGIPCIGIEPATDTAAAAKAKGIEIVASFFGTAVANDLKNRGKAADLMVANNVLAHVPDINDFTAGFAQLLKPQGVATFEFPHLLNLIAQCQFDTMYHEHFSYLSLSTVITIFTRNGLLVFDAEELSTHGGSLRVFACKCSAKEYFAEDAAKGRIAALLQKEERAGLHTTGFCRSFQHRAATIKYAFLSFLLDAHAKGKHIAAYGAAAKGNTLLNFAGVRSDLISFVVDRSPSKQGKYLPGSRIPIVDEHYLRNAKPDYVIIFPWNIKNEIMEQLSYIREWNAHFVTAMPHLEIL